jgi:hypothetical protein
MNKLIATILFQFWIFNYSIGQFETRIYNLHYETPFNQQVTDINGRYKTRDLSFGGNVCVGNKYLNTIVEYNFHRMNVENVIGFPNPFVKIHEILFGIRYYNARPTFLVGNAAFRLALGCSGGFDFDLNTRSTYFAGFAITGIREPSGILVQLYYRKSKNPIQGLLIEPYFGIRIGLVIGPSSS